MIVLDTNVISEIWKREPSPAVLTWLDAQLVETLYLSAITLAELRLGLAVMPAGQRRSVLMNRLENEVVPAFSGRILPFDQAAARAYADLMAEARRKGLAISQADGHIAATAMVHSCAVATRDVSPFKAAGLRVINPWG